MFDKDKANKNATMLKLEIDSLEKGHWSLWERQYKDFWAHVGSINQLFKTLKPLNHSDREILWKRLGQICKDVKSKQQSQFEDKRAKSSEHFSYIMSEINKSSYVKFNDFSSANFDFMKELGQKLKKSGSLLSKYKQEMLGSHKQECFDRIQEIRRDHDLWWKDYKSHKSSNQYDFKERVKRNIEKNRDRLYKANKALEHARDHAEELKDKISSAWSDKFKDMAYDWLSETEDKIKDIEYSIRQIEDWINEDECKLR